MERIRVLLVDDEPAVVETASALLADEFAVATAPGGEEALRLLAEGPFDVVCTDYDMPGMTGLELLREAQRGAPHLGGVLVTGYREYSSRADKSGGTYFLVLKPYEPLKLVELVRRAGQAARLRRVLRSINLGLPPESAS